MYGVSVQAVRGRGYRLGQAISWLDPHSLQRLLAGQGHDFSLIHRETVDSTNTQLMVEALSGARHRTVLYADYQTAGRGRRGRSWEVSLGGGLTFSVLWRFEQSISQLSGLSLVAGIAIARALSQISPVPVRLKWPNDVLAGYRKLAGILVEAQGELAGSSFAVIGIGINERLPAQHRQEIDQAIIDFNDLGVKPDRTQLVFSILRELSMLMDVFERQGLTVALSEWPAWHAHEGRQVMIRTPDGGTHEGKVAGLDASGGLLLQLPDGTHRQFSVGEVSLRPRQES